MPKLIICLTGNVTQTKKKKREGRGGEVGGRREGERECGKKEEEEEEEMERERKSRRRKRRKRSGERRGGEKKEKNSHMNPGWTHTELILKEIFKGEKPASF